MTEPAAPRPLLPAMESGGDSPPLSVWATAQRDARAQRAGRYPPAALAHPGKMLPAIAATAITATPSPATWSPTRCAASAPP